MTEESIFKEFIKWYDWYREVEGQGIKRDSIIGDGRTLEDLRHFTVNEILSLNYHIINIKNLFDAFKYGVLSERNKNKSIG